MVNYSIFINKNCYQVPCSVCGFNSRVHLKMPSYHSQSFPFQNHSRHLLLPSPTPANFQPLHLLTHSPITGILYTDIKNILWNLNRKILLHIAICNGKELHWDCSSVVRPLFCKQTNHPWSH